MALVVQGLVAGPLILCCLYGALCVYCCSCLTRAHAASPRLGIRKVFAMNCLLTAALRVLSFGSIAVIAALGYGHADDDDPSATQQFYEKALVVLFDFPDFSIVSAYVLLFLVWCEAFVQARHHWLNTGNFQNVWMHGYLMLNIVLYAAQVALYSLLFVPAVNKEILSELIYLTLAGINIALPAIWMLAYMYLSLRLSGFPMASRHSRDRLRSLGSVCLLWTAARLLWGFVALTSVLDGWLFQVAESKSLYSVELIGLFCCVEILPIVLVLIRENTLSNSLSFKARAEESSVFLSSEDSTAFLRNSIVDRNSPDDEDIKCVRHPGNKI